MVDMVDKLIEDIVEVTETLMTADPVDIEAFAHPDTKPTLNERIAGGKENWGGWGKWGKEKADQFRKKRETESSREEFVKFSFHLTVQSGSVQVYLFKIKVFS